MIWLVATVFVGVYVGMILGKIPGLALDRTGIALLGAIVLITAGIVPPGRFLDAIDVSTIVLLFGLMVLSAQFRLAGAYSAIVSALGRHSLGPSHFLGVIVVTTAVLSALLINDVVCLAVTPVVIAICSKRGFNPLPYLLAVACASNIGSAVTLVGNPQNILVGQTLRMSFVSYLLDSLVPVLLSLGSLWVILCHQYRNQWMLPTSLSQITVPPFSIWQTVKGMLIVIILLFVYLSGLFPRDLITLGGAGVLLCSRRLHSRANLSLVDWQLLVLFIGLFIVNFAVRESGLLHSLQSIVLTLGIDLQQSGWLFLTCAVLSNIVSNVPAVMLLLPLVEHPSAGAILALSSTLAGNLIIVGSIANIIVVDQAARMGIRIGWLDHAKTGLPVTMVSLAVAGLWLWIW